MLWRYCVCSVLKKTIRAGAGTDPSRNLVAFGPSKIDPYHCECSLNTKIMAFWIYSSCCSILVGATLLKSLRLRRFKSDLDDIWHDSSSNKYASTDGVGFLPAR